MPSLNGSWPYANMINLGEHAVVQMALGPNKVSILYKMICVRNPRYDSTGLVKLVNQTINADYDIVAEAEAILAEAALVSA